ncbi:MAG: hypothetical protein WCL53_00445 [Chloroflexota bacterium]
MRPAHAECMDVASTAHVTPAATTAAPAPASNAASAGAFAGALGDQQRRLAATDVLGSMPPMVAEQIVKSVPGGKSPMGAVEELFKAIKSGEMVPSAEQLAAKDCIIATTARATQAFDSPEAMWSTMRQMLGSGPVLQDAVSYAEAAQSNTTPTAAISTREEANAILGGPIPNSKLNWWETAIRFLVDQAHLAAMSAAGAANASAGSSKLVG